MINWKSFEAKYNNCEQWAFEQMSYFLFCAEMENYIGAFRYKNQPGIETEPIERDGKFYAFQAKYYGTKISENTKDIIVSIEKSHNKHSQPDILFLYVNNELSKNIKREIPQYQIKIEQAAENLKIKIEWRVRSHLEYQLSQPQNKWIFEIFFGSNGLDPTFFENQVEKEIRNLGPRFNKKLNFKLPIAKLFDNVAFNEFFYKRLIRIIDNWLTEKSYRKLKDNEHLSGLEKKLEFLQKKLIKWYDSFEYILNNPVLLDDFCFELQEFTANVRDKNEKLYALKDWKNSPKEFDSELGRLREIEFNNRNFLREIEELKVNLANHPTLIIHGDAGCGKSHLLGDIATQRKTQCLPSILLLGSTFNQFNTIEKNILNKLDLTCSFKDFLENLNSIGIRLNSRVFILIDAINEGAGADLWKNQISGFINEVAKYPAIGLVLTIRSTYFSDIIPEYLKSDSTVTIAKHEGFKGNEYEALKLFCEHHDLKLPSFPILNPEYTNPLFLHLICESVKKLPGKSFPKGFNGINKTYCLYKEALNRRFEEKRHEYKNREIVSCAIEKFGKALYGTDYGQLECKDALFLFDKEFPQFPHLLSDLIEECVFIKIRYDNGEYPQDIVSFSYQKLGDFFMAEELLKPYTTKEDIKIAFVNDVRFRKLTNKFRWSYWGIVEALAILLPEKYDLELIELIGLFLEKNGEKENREWHINNTYESFTQILLESIKWRELNSINEKKITRWLRKHGKIANEEWFNTLTELVAIPNHPFNGDRLHVLLKRYPMPERDSFWQRYLMYYGSYDDQNIAYPLRRLIDWAWMPEISLKTDAETARLVAQALAWVLSSTDIVLRDQTTKALVNLLEQQPESLIATLKTFNKVDDLYVSERLYAIAYGCILRTGKDESVRLIAQYIYDSIFKEGDPPPHILLRDYARNAIEYAIYKNVGIEVNLSTIRPPYNTQMPALPQSENEVKMLELDYDSPDFKQNHGSEQNAIYNSVISGLADFGRYIVDSTVNHFASFSFKEDENFKLFLKTLKGSQRDLIFLIQKCKELEYNFHRKYEFQNRMGIQWTNSQRILISTIETSEKFYLKQMDNLFNSEQIKYLTKSIIPYFERKLKKDNLNSLPIRYWIIKRVFEIGYDKKLHGAFDSTVRGYFDYNRDHNKVERIGKKYQWIAFYEIIAMIADNYKLVDSWSSGDKYEFYKGTWQCYLRNIDPAYITKNNDSVEKEIANINKEWFEDKEYTQWNYPDSEWVKTIDDLIDPKQVIEKEDPNGQVWLHLQHFIEWVQPKNIGVEKYGGRRKQIWYSIQGLLVKKSNKDRIVNYLKKQNFWGKWLPENRDDHSILINREKFWSPAYIDTYKNNKNIWEKVKGTQHKVIVATESANGGIEGDKSGANRSYNIPCKFIFEGMKLQYAPIDGNLKNTNDEVIVMNNNPRGVLIRKSELMKYLDENDLDIIWTLLGEKFSFDSNRDEESYFKVPCGVYYLDGGHIKGEIIMFDRV